MEGGRPPIETKERLPLLPAPDTDVVTAPALSALGTLQSIVVDVWNLENVKMEGTARDRAFRAESVLAWNSSRYHTLPADCYAAMTVKAAGVGFSSSD